MMKYLIVYAFSIFAIIFCVFTIIRFQEENDDQIQPLIESRQKEPLNVSLINTKNHPASVYSDDLARCIPFYDELDKARKNKIGKTGQPRTALLVLAAYKFKNHSIITLKTDGAYGEEVYCRYFDENRVEIGKGLKTHVFPEFSLYCCNREKTKYMTVTQKADDPINDMVEIQDRSNDVPKYYLSMCLAPMYGNESKWLLLAELIEHYKLQGVEHFYIYVKDTNEYLNRIIFDYERSDRITVTWLGTGQDRPLKEWQMVGIHDCLIRSRTQSEFSIFADLDERIMPNDGSKLIDYVRKVSTPESASLQFRPRWVLRPFPPPYEYEGDKTLLEHLPMQVFHNTSAWPGSVSHTSKCIIRPHKVHIMWVHYYSLATEGSVTYYIPPEEAVVWHYRDMGIDGWGTNWLKSVAAMGNFTLTYKDSSYMKKIYDNVKKKLDLVYLFDNKVENKTII